MSSPCYVFLPGGSFVLAIINHETHEVMLIHHFDTGKRVTLAGSFASALLRELQQPAAEPSPVLQSLERQHDWLTGLSSASLKPELMRDLLLGRELGLLFIEVTDQCNEQCIHCYASSSPACHNFLTLEELKSALLQSRKLGHAFVQFTGGEPLIHRDLLAAVAYALELGFHGVEIYTNGLLLSDRVIEQLSGYGVKLAFSLYAADEAVHDGITRLKGSHKRTVAAIHRARSRGMEVRVGMAVMEQNATQEQAMLDFVQQEFGLPLTSLRFDPVHSTGRGRDVYSESISLLPSQNSHMPDSKRSAVRHHVIQQDMLDAKPQTARQGKLAICANGNVTPCIFNREHVLGNIRSQSLAEILNVNPECTGNLDPSVLRWNACQQQLSCSDCQMVSYVLGAR